MNELKLISNNGEGLYMKKIIVSSIVGLSIILPSITHADIFKCKQIDGKIIYQDNPCTGKNDIVILRNGEQITASVYLDKKEKEKIARLLDIYEEQKEIERRKEKQEIEIKKNELKRKAKQIQYENETRFSTALKKEIKHGILYMGMSEDDLIWSIGTPSKINRNVNRNSSSAQYVYNYGRIRYVYSRNGIIDSWQTSD